MCLLLGLENSEWNRLDCVGLYISGLILTCELVLISFPIVKMN